MAGTPTQASAPAGGHGAAMPVSLHSRTKRLNSGSRAVKYCAPWSAVTSPIGVCQRRVDIRPPAPRPLSNSSTVWPADESTSAQARPATPAPIMAKCTACQHLPDSGSACLRLSELFAEALPTKPCFTLSKLVKKVIAGFPQVIAQSGNICRLSAASISHVYRHGANMAERTLHAAPAIA